MFYRVEIRLDIEAESSEHAYDLADEAANAIRGQVIEILDDDWNEVLYEPKRVS